MYKLKPGRESFTIVEGPNAGKTFRRGVAYQTRPKGYTKLFTKVQAASKTTSTLDTTAEKESE